MLFQDVFPLIIGRTEESPILKKKKKNYLFNSVVISANWFAGYGGLCSPAQVLSYNRYTEQLEKQGLPFNEQL